MGKCLVCYILCLTLKFNLIAQTAEPSATVDKNILQIELESLYTVQNEGSEKMKSWSIPNALFRFGIFNSVELHLNIPIVKEELWKNDHLVQSLNKFEDFQVGFSANLWKEKKLLPQASIMIRLILPTDKNYKLGKIVSLNLSNKISGNLTFNSNIGHIQETDNALSCFYIVNLTYQTSSKFHFFLENFGDLHNESLMSHNLNLGGGYNITEKLILDISASKGLNTNMFYAGGILTWIIKTK
ncbi:MAG: hypothetical protein CVU01_00100 [Bacteroidetes bacterium HGW-Bacteroidetes-18]|nr:MAG: hypothetical protein CVU01_00100 [Bacteroidetes bacterium HGW-Bacteroidetes-18]